MLRVQCMYGCRPGKASFGSRPMSLSIVALSIAFTSGPTGGKSTMRKIDPRGGGGTPIVRSARSDRPEMSAGVSSVTHKSVDVTPTPGLTVAFGALPSITTTPLPRSSRPVTTRLIGLFITSCPLAVSATMLTPPEYETPHAAPKQCCIVVQLPGRWLVKGHAQTKIPAKQGHAVP